MFDTYFGDVKNGRLLRLAYLKYYLIMIAIIMVLMISIGLMIGVGEQMIGGDLQQAQDKLRAWFTLPSMVILGVLMIALVFAGANIAAKRIRDMGLPGWWVVLAVFLLSGGISTTTDHQGGSVGFLLLLALVFIPSNTFGKSKNSNQL